MWILVLPLRSIMSSSLDRTALVYLDSILAKLLKGTPLVIN